MGPEHRLDAVGNQLAAREGELHPFVAHGDAVADGDGVELERHPAGLADLAAHQLADAVQVAVAGHDVGEGVAYRDERLFDVATLDSGGVEQGTVGGAFEAGLDDVAAHGRIPRWKLLFAENAVCCVSRSASP
jgi:hypothetical protein